MSGFRFPNGVEFLGEDGGLASFAVSIPTDEDGFLGRECPKCEQHFRIAHQDYEELPEEVQLWCVYCGHRDDHSEFITPQQYDRVMRAASDYAYQLASSALNEAFGRMARRSRNAFVRVSYRSKPFYPAPLPDINEERLIRERSCEACGLRYAVFGEHRFCPACGLLSPLLIALDALWAETVRLDALSDLPEDVKARLRESGVLDRTYVDTIENVVGIVEAIAERTFRVHAEDPDGALKGKGKVFQRLDDLADLFEVELSIDLRTAIGAKWNALREAWAARHVFTHCDGIVDEKYLKAVPQSPLRAGERLRISEQFSRTTVSHAEALCRAIATGSAPREGS